MRPFDLNATNHEAARVAELHRYAAGYDSLQDVFDTVTSLCTMLFHADASLITFVGDNSSFVKSCSGINLGDTSQSGLIASYNIMSKDVFVVPNASEDMRFIDTHGEAISSGIGFYAGASLKTGGGFNIGVLSIIDSLPRSEFLSVSQLQLSNLAKVVSSRLDQLIAGPGSRAAVRHSVDLQGMISSYGKKPEPVSIHNISTGGAMIHSLDRVLPRGEEVIMSIDTMAFVGTVMWARDGLNGLSFHRAIDEKSLAIIKKSRAKSQRILV